MCTEGPASGDPEANSTSAKKGFTSSTAEDTCFPVEPDAVTLMLQKAQQVVIRRQTQHLKI